MATVKCISCSELRREELRFKGKPMVVYNCARYFPYACALSGLFRPASRIVEAVKDCPELVDLNCVVAGCLNLDLTTYGKDKMVFICKDHDRAWGKWLDEHPKKRDYIAPLGSTRRSNWVEVFREFVESQRGK